LTRDTIHIDTELATANQKEFLLTRITHTLVSVVLIGAITAAAAYAGEISHFTPGVANIRDLAVPEPGLYVVI